MTSDHTTMTDQPLLTSTSWNDEWKKIQKGRGPGNTADYWNKRAKTFSKGDAPSAYVKDFLALAALRPSESVFDMGCGNGALAIPLAFEGHPVIAADFSTTMLDVMENSLAEHDIPYLSYKDSTMSPNSNTTEPPRHHERDLQTSTFSLDFGTTSSNSNTHSPKSNEVAPSDQPYRPLVVSKLLSWDDDWKAADVLPKSVDVAFASRSITTKDLQDSLMRLNTIARRRACVTLATGSTPRIDVRILKEIGITDYYGRDYLYAFMILSNLGFQPEVRFIESTRDETYDTPADAYEALHRMIVDAVGSSKSDGDMRLYEARLRAWMPDHVVKNPNVGSLNDHGEVEKAYRLLEPRTVSWAFISWSTSAISQE